MKTLSIKRFVIVASLFCLVASSALAATQNNINSGFSIFSSTNLVVLKQFDDNQKSSTNWPAYATLAIGFMVAVIGFLQWHLAMEKFKLDLFDRRFVVFKGIQKFLSTVMRNPRISWDDPIVLLRETQDAVFLFNQDIVDYIDSLYKKSLDMKELQMKYDPLPVGPERSALCKQESELVKELMHELPRLKDVFAPYLRFKVWKWPFI
jgi:hypothetical protein